MVRWFANMIYEPFGKSRLLRSTFSLKHILSAGYINVYAIKYITAFGRLMLMFGFIFNLRFVFIKRLSFKGRLSFNRRLSFKGFFALIIKKTQSFVFFLQNIFPANFFTLKG